MNIATKYLSVKLEIFFYPYVLTLVLGAQKNCLIETVLLSCLIETVLLSSQNICFG